LTPLEAIRHFERGLAVLSALPEGPAREEREIELQLARGLSLFTAKGFGAIEAPEAPLVVDVTNFSPKTDAFGSRENLHLVERWTRTGPTTMAYEVKVEDPTVWTRPWTVRQDFGKQRDQENRLYAEPRCIEGNQGLPGLLHGRRAEDLAFAEGRGYDPQARTTPAP
jgi:hypothetical protein